MDLTLIDTRVKTLMRLKHVSEDDARQLLQESNWDVAKACSMHTQRTGVSASGYPGGTISNSGVTLMRMRRQRLPSIADDENTPDFISDIPPDASTFQEPATDIISDVPGPRLHRGMSKATINVPIIMIARDIIQKDAEAAMTSEKDDTSFIQTTEFTFVLPDLTCYPEDFKAFLYKDLIDSATLVSLEQGGHLNWWADVGACQRLLPMVTSGDGNCLLHAASLGMWGFHDRQLILRRLLYDALTNSSSSEAFRRRWRYQQMMAFRECGLILSEEEWDGDWKHLIQLSSPQPRNSTQKNSTDSAPRYERSYAGQSQESELVYESLEELHVFVLAHVLRRPIIVIAKSVLCDVNGEALSPIPFGGIYLPLDWDSHQCHSSPLLLTYDMSHFCALVSMESFPLIKDANSSPQLADAIPLVNPQLELLPIRFSVDPGKNYDFSSDFELDLTNDGKIALIQRYFGVDRIVIQQRPTFDEDGYLDFPPGSANHKNELVNSDSEDSTGSAKDRSAVEDFDKKSASKPINFITKSFDTLGTKLKNITKINRTSKLERKGSIGVATQSTRLTSLTVEMLKNQTYVLCARLSHRKTGYQDQIIGNYLAMMKEKFGPQQARRQQQNAEIRRLSAEFMGHRRTATAGNLGKCNEPFPVDRGQSGATKSQRDSRIQPGGVMDQGEMSFQRQDTMVITGKSKFYTTASEDQCPTLDRMSEFKKLDGILTKEKADGEPKIQKYNKIDTFQLQTVGDRTEFGGIQGVSSWGTLPRHGTKIPDDSFDPTLIRKTGASHRVAADRFSADPTIFRKQNQLVTERLPTGIVTVRAGAKDPSTNLLNPTAVSVSQRASASAEAIAQNRAPEDEQRICRTELCRFYGTAATDFFCSKCFREKNSKLCITPNCLLQGHQAQGGLCNVCYQKKCYSHSVQYPTAKTKL